VRALKKGIKREVVVANLSWPGLVGVGVLLAVKTRLFNKQRHCRHLINQSEAHWLDLNEEEPLSVSAICLPSVDVDVDDDDDDARDF